MWPMWETADVTHQAGELIRGTGEFWVTERDLEGLAMLLEHSFLGRRHLPFEQSIAVANKRLLRLYMHGLLARCREDVAEGRASAWVYGLTRLGFEVLVLNGNVVALAAEPDWDPPYAAFGTRNNVVHQLAIADLATTVIRHAARAGVPVDWRGSKRLVQRVHPMAVGGQRLEVSPDAALLFGNGTAVLVEHERSLRPGDVHDRMTKYKRYFDGRVWEASFAREPKVLFSVDVLGNTQGYSESVYNLAKEAAASLLLFPAMFIREDVWRVDKLTVEAVAGNRSVDLLQAVGLALTRRPTTGG